jgi:hypothetical protein
MILPPTGFLRFIRILGSALLIAGLFTFLVCAARVYVGKLLRWGVAESWFYRFLRHPQYTGLAVLGLGMAILWPRFIVLAMLGVMLFLYYLLARDEEGRMLRQFGERYRGYMERTGMFLPRLVEQRMAPVVNLVPGGALRGTLCLVAVIGILVGGGFGLRAITLHSLPVYARANLTLTSILPEDEVALGAVWGGMEAYMQTQQGSALLSGKQYLGYVMPADYIMQGMIADTGGASQLHKQHHTPALIADWVFHPFAHLRRPPSVQMAKMHGVDPAMARRHHCPVGINAPSLECASCPYRRVILVEVEAHNSEGVSGLDCLSIWAHRKPACYADIDTRTGQVINIHAVGEGTAWKDVPTPVI